jgi:hypothetical protein
MWVLMIVTYPGCNREGGGCREIIDFFHSFEAMVEFTDHWMARIIMEDRCCEDDHTSPGWDYSWYDEKEHAA